MSSYYRSGLLALLVSILVAACGGTRNFTVLDLTEDQSVKFYFSDGTTDNGIILEKENSDIRYISASNHELVTVSENSIRRVEKTDIVYDYMAYEISKAEIDKTKSSQNTWGYAIGGAIIGGAAGLAVGLPLWYADVDQVPPYFYAGAGAVAGSIYFAFRGQEKDRQNAIRQIRLERLSDQNLQEELKDEKQRIDELEIEKQRLKEKLREKQQEKTDQND